MKTIISAIAASLCLAAWTMATAAPVDAPVDGQVNVQAAPDPSVHVVAQALARGLDAEQRRDGRAMLEAAIVLIRSGAHAEDGADLALVWIRKARRLGVRPAADQLWRGRTLGPAYRNGHVRGHGDFHTRQTFNAGEKARIVVVPTDGGALGLDVRDDDGKAICSVAASTRDLGCDWVPSFTGGNEIVVRNDGDGAQAFYIVLN